VDVSRRLRLVFGSYPNYYDTFAPHMDGEFVPAIRNAAGVMVANDKYKDVPGAVLREGNQMPLMAQFTTPCSGVCPRGITFGILRFWFP
jgi:hypothetical protein